MRSDESIESGRPGELEDGVVYAPNLHFATTFVKRVVQAQQHLESCTVKLLGLAAIDNHASYGGVDFEDLSL